MKFARDCRSSESNEATAQLLFEALPWIKNLTGKTVVIKYGGAAMVDEQLRRDVMSDIVLLKIIGMLPLVIAAFPAVFVIHVLGVFLCRGSRIVMFISG